MPTKKSPSSSLAPVDITLAETIPYKAMDDTPGGGNLGRAEFQFCPVWKRGIMVELLIYRAQQRDKTKAYRLPLAEAGRVTTFSFDARVEHERPRPWRMFWCKEHKNVTYEVYVPSGTDQIKFRPHFGNSLDVYFEARS